jgi:hypothetical protein
MSNTPFDRNPDLRRLRDEGFDLALSASNNHLLVRKVPYLASATEVRYGTLITVLNQSGDLLNPPKDHVVYFIGDQPRNLDGSVIAGIFNGEAPRDLDKDLRSDRTFSGKPDTPFQSYYDKITRYVRILESPARVVNPSVDARTFPPYEMTVNDSVFKYADTASSRAHIAALSGRLEANKIAIVGVGGSGSYILDFLAKAPIKEIHIFDGDVFSSHNAFRAPGAASLETLRTRPTKAAYHKAVYENIRHTVIAHEYNVTAENVGELDEMEFVFLSMDGGDDKRIVVEHLRAKGIGFIDVNMGLDADCDAVAGLVSLTTCTGTKSDHIGNRLSFAEPNADDEYDSNIQIVELNALNAALAVIKWKKLRGFYATIDNEHFTVYTVRANSLINADVA